MTAALSVVTEQIRSKISHPAFASVPLNPRMRPVGQDELLDWQVQCLGEVAGEVLTNQHRGRLCRVRVFLLLHCQRTFMVAKRVINPMKCNCKIRLHPCTAPAISSDRAIKQSLAQSIPQLVTQRYSMGMEAVPYCGRGWCADRRIDAARKLFELFRIQNREWQLLRDNPVQRSRD